MSSRGDRVPVTVFVPILNEAANLKKCLDSVAGFQQVFVIDSGSTDGSKQIAIDHGAEFVEFSYSGSYPKKRQWALENFGIKTDKF